MILTVNVEKIISRDCDDVFEAIYNPAQMRHYFISSGSGKLEAGKEVIWRWEDVGAELAIKVLQADKERKTIEFHWDASGSETKVQIILEQAGKKTVVKIHETGWESNEEGIQRYGQQIQGWVDMVTCMKAYLEFGINLRAGKVVEE
ncbi:SRPBCC domain-containing protein [Heyndrickxia sp. MSNUG]|uniref:SRPBCC domain-containing protein n=1 Tax=Heyndrickxia sp. MSNUG TaxID=3136677 RepID=UPI003C2F372A